MKFAPRWFMLMLLVLTLQGLYSQPLPFPKNKFRAPLDIPLYLAGNFGELRSNHFHTGLDIKTMGRTGLKVQAAEQGRVARIKVSPWGYGRALYLAHPGGYTTVYGHLSQFAPTIQKIVRQRQYQQRSFAVDFAPDTIVHVEKGQVVARSGDSGSSSGPHLHFEIRNTSTQRALNPLKFGFDIKDNIAPTIRGIRFYPLEQDSRVDGLHEEKSYVVTGTNGNYRMKYNPNITLHGKVGVALHAIDKLNGFPNVCGIYHLRLDMDGRKVMSQKIDSLSFYTNRYVNAYKDYRLYHKNYWHYHRSYRLPNNKLDIYSPGEYGNRGILNFKDPTPHTLEYRVWDAYGNKSELSLKVSGGPATPRGKELRKQMVDVVKWDKDNSIKKGNMRVFIPNSALYQNMRFTLDSLGVCKGCVSGSYAVGDPYVPLQKSITIRFKMIPYALQFGDQLTAARTTPGGRVRYAGGEIDGTDFELRTRHFGKYALRVDSLPPTIRPLTHNTTNQGQFKIRVRDNFSGFSRYNAWLGDKWLLLRYEPKQALMSANLSEVALPPGKTTLRVEIVDNCGNTKEYEREIIVK